MRMILLVTTSALAFTATGAEALMFAYDGHIDTWVVPVTGLYDFTVAGSAGGSSGGATFFSGGFGAIVGGDISLVAGTTLQIVVGGQPNMSRGSGSGSGGGGGSFVFTGGAPIFVAGGGGGEAYHDFSYQTGGPGLVGPMGGSGGHGVAGGTGGFGGAGGAYGGGGGGGGWRGSGGNAANLLGRVNYKSGYGGSGPPSFTGGKTAVPITPYGYEGGTTNGGFGGGGGGGYNGGGGGGGYSGGGGGFGYETDGGGGGGSFVAGNTLNVREAGGANNGLGYIEIKSLVPEPSSWSLLLTGLGFLGYVLRRRVMRRT